MSLTMALQKHKKTMLDSFKFSSSLKRPNLNLREASCRSRGADLLHHLIMRCCCTEREQLDHYLNRLKGYLSNTRNFDILKEKSFNGETHLDDILHLPFDKQKNKRFAQQISTSLLQIIMP